MNSMGCAPRSVQVGAAIITPGDLLLGQPLSRVLRLPEPSRTRAWTATMFEADSEGEIDQAALWGMYRMQFEPYQYEQTAVTILPTAIDVIPEMEAVLRAPSYIGPNGMKRYVVKLRPSMDRDAVLDAVLGASSEMALVQSTIACQVHHNSHNTPSTSGMMPSINHQSSHTHYPAALSLISAPSADLLDQVDAAKIVHFPEPSRTRLWIASLFEIDPKSNTDPGRGGVEQATLWELYQTQFTFCIQDGTLADKPVPPLALPTEVFKAVVKVFPESRVSTRLDDGKTHHMIIGIKLRASPGRSAALKKLLTIHGRRVGVVPSGSTAQTAQLDPVMAQSVSRVGSVSKRVENLHNVPKQPERISQWTEVPSHFLIDPSLSIEPVSRNPSQSEAHAATRRLSSSTPNRMNCQFQNNDPNQPGPSNLRTPPQHSSIVSLRRSPDPETNDEDDDMPIIPSYAKKLKQARRKQNPQSSSNAQLARSPDTESDERLPNYPQHGQQFESLEHFKHAFARAAWPRGHNIYKRNVSSYTYTFACSRDRSPPKGFGCRFRISVISSNAGPQCTVNSVDLSHTGHAPKPGDYAPKPAQREWLKTFDLEMTVAMANTPDTDHEPKSQSSKRQSIPHVKRAGLESQNGLPKSSKWVKLNTSCVESGSGQLWAPGTATENNGFGGHSEKEEVDDDSEIEIVSGTDQTNRVTQSNQFDHKRKRSYKEVSPSPPAIDEVLEEEEEQQKEEGRERKCSKKNGTFLGVFLPAPVALDAKAKEKKRRDLSRNWNREGDRVSSSAAAIELGDPTRESSPCALPGISDAYILPIEPSRTARKTRAAVVCERKSKRNSRHKTVNSGASIEAGLQSNFGMTTQHKNWNGEAGVTIDLSTLDELPEIEASKDTRLGNGPTPGNSSEVILQIGQTHEPGQEVALRRHEEAERAKLEALITSFISGDSFQEEELESETETLESLLRACHYKLPSLLPHLRGAGLTTAASLMNLNQSALFDLLQSQEQWMASLLWRRMNGRLSCDSEIASRIPDCRCWCWPRPIGPIEEGICDRCLFWKVKVSCHGFVQDG